MTRDVLIQLSGIQEGVLSDEEGENEAVEIIAPGQYFFRNGKHYILYEEAAEGISDVTKNQIKLTGEDLLEVRKRGLVDSCMIFDKGKFRETFYTTPYGQMLMGITTRELDVLITEEKIQVRMEYLLEVEHQTIADCTLKLDVTPMGTEL